MPIIFENYVLFYFISAAVLGLVGGFWVNELINRLPKNFIVVKSEKILATELFQQKIIVVAAMIIFFVWVML